MNRKIQHIGMVIVAAMAGFMIEGCAGPSWDGTQPNDVHNRFGDAVRQARAQQTLNPEAGRNTDPVAGIDGVAAQNTIGRYQTSFKEPPPTFNILGIGGTSVAP